MKILSGGDLVVRCLVDQKVKYVFLIIGGQIATILDALGHTSEIEVIVPRCETTGPLMACGYAASTGQPAVSMATVGAGVVYEVAGLAKAWFDYLPVISIAPQVQSWKTKPHQESLQACNQDEIFYPLTKWNSIIYHWERIPGIVHRGFREAFSGIPGPVHIDIPVDVLFKRRLLTKAKQNRLLPAVGKTAYNGRINGDKASLAHAAQALNKAKRPLVIVGQGIGRPGRYEGIRRTLNALNMPVITTSRSSGILCGKDPSYAGDANLYAGSEDGRKLLEQADLLLIVGIDPTSNEIISLDRKSDSQKTIVQMEMDPSALLYDTGHVIGIHSDPESGLTFLNEATTISQSNFTTWRDEFISAGKTLAQERSLCLNGLQNYILRIFECSTSVDIWVVDGPKAVLAAQCLANKADYHHLFIMDEHDLPGAGLPFAIGACLGNPEKRVNLLCDKDDLFCHIRELQPAVTMGLSINIICIDEAPTSSNVADTKAVAQAFGCDVYNLERGASPFPQLKHGHPNFILIPDKEDNK